ncbi:aldehyde dehydrogenase family protein [Paenibacillus cremeus]|uniref:Aldehyde dehydrogenase family protein n=1 Tax=Paenibacillus cremeus TaxID=2163881 RepID=A0A559JRC7_9BACL|nr:aldehyde dehydrogenase family protein [Paenibacillus cremeus]TVY02426.1 aldehyde dehydrogenase family protein [Paenibacillus cremeus]
MDSERIELLINNQEVPTDRYSEIKDPGRLTDVVGYVAMGNVHHVDQAVQAAYQAFLSWKKTSLEERMTLLSHAAKVLKDETLPLSSTMSRETGMLLKVSQSEINLAIRVIQVTLEHAEDFLRPIQMEDENSWVSIEKRPIGVIAGIVPWNAPMVLTMQKVAPALVAGNTVVIKPSPNAPMSVSIALKKIASLFPAGVINVIHGESDIGSALNKHPLVRKISFTGGGNIAKQIMKDAADSLKSIQFELGGNDPAIVLDDANLDEVIPKIVNRVFWRSGQICIAVKRIYVPNVMYESFYSKMCEIVDEFKIGHSLDERSTFGPVNNNNQYQYVKGLVSRIKLGSAKIVELGKRLEPEQWNNGYYLQPAIVRDVDPMQEIVTCEQFGPVIPLIPYRTDEEVIQMANKTEYGLGSSVWTCDFERALRISREMEAGMTFINGHGQSRLGHEFMPFGGVKQSGIGRENSEVGLAEFIEYHAINYHKPQKS